VGTISSDLMRLSGFQDRLRPDQQDTFDDIRQQGPTRLTAGREMSSSLSAREVSGIFSGWRHPPAASDLRSATALHQSSQFERHSCEIQDSLWSSGAGGRLSSRTFATHESEGLACPNRGALPSRFVV
jgi:hypothetical protein